MSYILEALRRSQAERERGRVPGLDAQPLPADPASGPRRGVPLAWVGSGLAVVLLLIVLLGAWWLQQPRVPQAREDRPDTTALQSPPNSPPAQAPGPAPGPAPTAAAPPTPALPQVVSLPPAPPPARPPAVPSPGLTVEPAAAQTAAVPPVQAQPAPPAAPRSLTMAQLSADQRRELPAMVVGGSIWSDNAANRFVIINGQVVREGESAAPGVTLERIAPKSATLRWREVRVELPL